MLSTLKNTFGWTRYKYGKRILKFIKNTPSFRLSEEELYGILNLYEEFLKCGGHSALLKYKALEYMFIRAFCSNCHDSDYVEKLLLHFCDRTSGNFVLFLYFVSEFQIPQTCRPSIFRLKFAEFVLIHANNRHFVISEMRFANLLVKQSWPLKSMPSFDLSKLLLLLVRYGALTKEENPLSVIDLLIKIVKVIVQIIEEENFNVFHDYGLRNKMFDSMAACGKILLQICPQIRQKMFFQATRIILSSEIPVSEQICMFNYILPELGFRIFQPLSLKHMCRLTIREVLYENWLLPDGIRELPLAQSIKNYLDLLC